MAEMEARFSILDSQMKELREENSRLTNDVSNFTTLMSEREEEESCHFALKTPLSVLSSAGNRTSHYRTTPSKLGSNLDTCNGDISCRLKIHISCRLKSHVSCRLKSDITITRI